MVMGSVTLNTKAERRKFLNKNTQTRDDTRMIGTKKNTFQLELKKQVHSTRRTLRHRQSKYENMTEMIQQSAMSIAKQIK